MDDTPYYYCTQAILKLMEGDKEAAQEQLLSAIRIYGGTSAIQAFTDAMTEAGILPSPYGQTVPTEQPVKTGLENAVNECGSDGPEALSPGRKRPDCRLVHGRRPYQDGGKKRQKNRQPLCRASGHFLSVSHAVDAGKEGGFAHPDLRRPAFAAPGPPESYLRLSAAGYFARLFLQMLEPDTPIPEFTTCCRGPTPTWKQ